MTVNGWLQLAIFVAVLTALVPFLGGYMARVYQGERILLERPLGWLERLIYRLIGPPSRGEQDWKSYGKTTIVFSLVFFVVLYVILRTQSIHPFNPEGFNSAPWDVTFNTTSSFITNTNWQFYGGETSSEIVILRPARDVARLNGRPFDERRKDRVRRVFFRVPEHSQDKATVA